MLPTLAHEKNELNTGIDVRPKPQSPESDVKAQLTPRRPGAIKEPRPGGKEGALGSSSSHQRVAINTGAVVTRDGSHSVYVPENRQGNSYVTMGKENDCWK